MNTKQATTQETAGTFKSIQHADPTGTYKKTSTGLNGYFGKKNKTKQEQECWKPGRMKLYPLARVL